MRDVRHDPLTISAHSLFIGGEGSRNMNPAGMAPHHARARTKNVIRAVLAALLTSVFVSEPGTAQPVGSFSTPAAPSPRPDLELVLIYDELAGETPAGDFVDWVAATAADGRVAAAWQIAPRVLDRLAALSSDDAQATLQRLGALEALMPGLVAAGGHDAHVIRARFVPWMSAELYGDRLSRLASSPWPVVAQVPSTWTASLRGALAPLPFSRRERREMEASLHEIAKQPYRDAAGDYTALGAWIEVRIGLARNDLLLDFARQRHGHALASPSAESADESARAQRHVDALLALASGDDDGEAFLGFLRELGDWLDATGADLSLTTATRFPVGAPTRGGLAGGYDVIHTTEETVGLALFERMAVEGLAPLTRAQVQRIRTEDPDSGVDPATLERAFFANPPVVAIIATAPNRLNRILADTSATNLPFRTFAWRSAFAGGSGFGVVKSKSTARAASTLAAAAVRFLAVGDGTSGDAHVVLAQAFGYVPAARPTPQSYLEPGHFLGALAPELALVAVPSGFAVRRAGDPADPRAARDAWRALASPIPEILSRAGAWKLGAPSDPTAERRHAEELTAAFARLAETRKRLALGTTRLRWFNLAPDVRAELDSAMTLRATVDSEPAAAPVPAPSGGLAPLAWVLLAAAVAAAVALLVARGARRDATPTTATATTPDTTVVPDLAAQTAARSERERRTGLLEELAHRIESLCPPSDSATLWSRIVVANANDLLTTRGNLLDEVAEFWPDPPTPRQLIERLVERVQRLHEEGAPEPWVDARAADAARTAAYQVLSTIKRLGEDLGDPGGAKLEAAWPASAR